MQTVWNVSLRKCRKSEKDIRFSACPLRCYWRRNEKALEEHGIFCDFIPTAYSSKDMAEAMVPHIGKDESVLLLRAEEANRVLPDALEEAGISHTCISLYHTVTDERKADELNRLIKMADYVTFASSSAVRAFVSMVDNLDEVKGKYISIGRLQQRRRKRMASPSKKLLLYIQQEVW